jgi:hypothetical protein
MAKPGSGVGRVEQELIERLARDDQGGVGVRRQR